MTKIILAAIGGAAAFSAAPLAAHASCGRVCDTQMVIGKVVKEALGKRNTVSEDLGAWAAEIEVLKRSTQMRMRTELKQSEPAKYVLRRMKVLPHTPNHGIVGRRRNLRKNILETCNS